MMVRAEDPGTAIVRVFVQPVDYGLTDSTAPIAHQEVIQYQPRQRMKGMPPARQYRRHAEVEAGLGEEAPGLFGSSAAQVKVGSKDGGIVPDRRDEVLRLESPTGSA
jgi:hypothetical protein